MEKIRYRCPVCMENKLLFVNKTVWKEETQEFICKLDGEVFCETCGYEGIPEKVDLETKTVLGFKANELKITLKSS